MSVARTCIGLMREITERRQTKKKKKKPKYYMILLICRI